MSEPTKIKLQDAKLPELEKGLSDIEGLMKDYIDHQQIEQVSEQLGKATQLLHVTGRLMEIATRIYDNAKGEAAYKLLANPQINKAATTLQVKIIEGMMSEQSALYMRADRTVKSLTIYIEGIRSLLSKNKEQERISNYKNNG